jgi:hypothetical protein
MASQAKPVAINKSSTNARWIILHVRQNGDHGSLLVDHHRIG